MAIPAQEFEVVEVQSDLRIVDVRRSDVHLVVNCVTMTDNAVVITPLTQTACLFDIS